MTTYTIYGNTADGWIFSSNANYATARAGSGLTVNTTGPPVWNGQEVAAAVYYIYETFLQFDCSVIDAGETVSSAFLNCYLHTDLSSDDYTINAKAHDWGASLTTADWVAGADLSGLTQLGVLATSGLSAGYNVFSDVAMAGHVDAKSATTGVLLASNLVEAGTAPTGTEVVAFYSANQSGTSFDPALDVTAEEGVGGWTGKIAGVTNPTKVIGISALNIAKIDGVA